MIEIEERTDVTPLYPYCGASNVKNSICCDVSVLVLVLGPTFR